MSAPIDILIRGAEVATPHGVRDADVAISGGRIAAVAESGALDPGAGRTIDAHGLLLLPGVVDEHVHPIYLDDPRDTSLVAARGGVTSVMHFAYAHPGESLLESVEELRERCAGSVLDFAIHAGMFDPAEQLSEMEAVAATGVRTFKLFLAYAAQGWMTDDAALVSVLERASDLDSMVMVHCENGPAIDALERRARRGELGEDPIAAMLATRPAVLEAEATNRALAIAEALDAPIFIVHVTNERALDAVRAARARGQWAIAETCPQYLWLTEADVHRYGALAKIGPPLRTQADTEALWEALADGTLQCVGSDHVPKKRPGEFTHEQVLDAGFGAPSIETMLTLVYEGAANSRISIERMVQILSENPARAFGLWPHKGCIAVGADADLVLWDPTAERTLGAGHSNAGYSLYDGRSVSGTPLEVIVGGRSVVRDGQLLDEDPHGSFLATGPFQLPG